MAILRFKNQVPTGGFNYRQRETQLVIRGESLGELVIKVKAHREHKGLPNTDPAGIELEVQRQICGRLGVNDCIAEGIADEWVPIDTTNDFFDLGKIKSFSSAVWSFVQGGTKFADMGEAKRRAAICDDCPCNNSFEGCKCGPLAQWVSSVIPKERIIPSLENRGCAVCSCALQTLVHAPDSAIVAAHKANPLALPKKCWKWTTLGRQDIS